MCLLCVYGRRCALEVKEIIRRQSCAAHGDNFCLAKCTRSDCLVPEMLGRYNLGCFMWFMFRRLECFTKLSIYGSWRSVICSSHNFKTCCFKMKINSHVNYFRLEVRGLWLSFPFRLKGWIHFPLKYQARTVYVCPSLCFKPSASVPAF